MSIIYETLDGNIDFKRHSIIHRYTDTQKRQRWGTPRHQPHCFHSLPGVKPWRSLATGHGALANSFNTHRTLTSMETYLQQHRVQGPQEGYFKALASLFPQIPYAERCYRLPHDSSGCVMRIRQCCNLGLSSRFPHILCYGSLGIFYTKNPLFHKQSSTEHLAKRPSVGKHIRDK